MLLGLPRSAVAHCYKEATLGTFVPHPGADHCPTTRAASGIRSPVSIQVKPTVNSAIDEIHTEKSPLALA